MMDMSPVLFGLYKLAKYGLYPLTWILLILGLLIPLTWLQSSPRRLRWRPALAIAAFLILYILGAPFVANRLVGLIEEQAPPFDLTTSKRFDAIVVLGGGVSSQGTLRPTNELSPSSMQRTMCGADLYTKGFAPRIIFAGGDASIFGEGPQEGVEMQRLALRLGIPEEATIVEGRSRTTYENAVATKQILGASSVLMVTSAYHVPRAIGLFRKQGVDAIPYPCAYIARDRIEDGWNGDLFDLIPEVESLRRSTVAINELVGTLIYRISGKI
nr:YdcF family protein [Nitrospirota bacterium]